MWSENHLSLQDNMQWKHPKNNIFHLCGGSLTNNHYHKPNNDITFLLMLPGPPNTLSGYMVTIDPSNWSYQRQWGVTWKSKFYPILCWLHKFVRLSNHKRLYNSVHDTTPKVIDIKLCLIHPLQEMNFLFDWNAFQTLDVFTVIFCFRKI